MKKILIIAQNQAKADEGAALFKGFNVKRAYGESKSYSRHYDAVVVYFHQASEINFFKDLLNVYQEAPIKVFVGKEPYSEAGAYKAKCFTDDNADAIIGELAKQYQELDEMMTKIFKSFDKDSSGYIDINELKDVSKELGKTMDAAELEECMKDLDQNKDNMISYPEFKAWWLSGRQGLSPWMRRLLAFKLKTFKFVDQIHGTVADVIKASSSESVEIAQNSVSLNINRVEHAGTTIAAKIMLISDEVKHEFHNIKTMHKFEPTEEPLLGRISFEVREGSAQDVLAQIDGILNSDMIQMIFGDMLKQHVSIISEGKKISIGFQFPSPLASQIAPFAGILNALQSDLKVDQNVEMSLRLAASPADILSEGAEPVLMQLLKGISVDVKLNVWKKMADVLLKIVEAGELDSSMLPLLGGLAPAFLIRMNANLDITIDDHMKAKLTENPMLEPILLDAPTLISSLSKVSDDEDESLKEHLSSLIPLPPLVELAMLLLKQVGDEVTFSFVGNYLGLKGRISGTGLNLLLKNVAKFGP